MNRCAEITLNESGSVRVCAYEIAQRPDDRTFTKAISFIQKFRGSRRQAHALTLECFERIHLRFQRGERFLRAKQRGSRCRIFLASGAQSAECRSERRIAFSSALATDGKTLFRISQFPPNGVFRIGKLRMLFDQSCAPCRQLLELTLCAQSIQIMTMRFLTQLSRGSIRRLYGRACRCK